MQINRCVNCMEEMTGTICEKCGFDNSRNTQMGIALQWNTLLKGRYLVGKVLGQGGFGITYIGFDMLLNIKVAIKEYFPMGQVIRDNNVSNQITWMMTEVSKEQQQNACENVLKEARKMVKIDQIPEIVRIRDVFFENQTAYIVMDYIRGMTLKEALQKNGTMKYSECVTLFQPLIEAMAKVHKHGLIHRDISPDNIMIQPDGSPLILDFGAAKDLTRRNNLSSLMVAKQGFSPAEQYMENGVIGTWTDVYAMCATFYYCIFGRLVPGAMERLMQDKLSFDFPMKEALPMGAEETLRAGLALKPEDRIQTMEELARRLLVDNSAEEERKKQEEQRRQEEERKKQEELRRQEEERKRQEERRRQEEERKRQEEQKKQTKKSKSRIGDMINWKQDIKILAVIVICLVAGVFSELEEKERVYQTETGLEYRRDKNGAVICGYEGEQTEVGIPYMIDGYPVYDIDKDSMPKKCRYFWYAEEDDLWYDIENEEVMVKGYDGDLTSFMIPETIEGYPVTTVRLIGGSQAKKLEEVVLPEGVKEVADSAFYECINLTYIGLPESVEKIGYWAFKGCINLKEIRLPNGVTEVGNQVFAESGLETIFISAGASGITGNELGGLSSNFKEFIVEGGSVHYKAVDGVLYSADGKTLVSCPRGKQGTYTVEPGTEVIGEGAFYNCDELEKIILADTVIEIKATAAWKCGKLTEIIMPQSVKKIGPRAFEECNNLTQITISRDCEIAESHGGNFTIKYYE